MGKPGKKKTTKASPTPDQYQMKAADFDEMMGKALNVPPPKVVRKTQPPKK